MLESKDILIAKLSLYFFYYSTSFLTFSPRPSSPDLPAIFSPSVVTPSPVPSTGHSVTPAQTTPQASQSQIAGAHAHSVSPSSFSSQTQTPLTPFCVSCGGASRDATTLPCRHRCLCMECASSKTNCPMCGSKIENILCTK